jgi:hypothetical protein
LQRLTFEAGVERFACGVVGRTAHGARGLADTSCVTGGSEGP